MTTTDDLHESTEGDSKKSASEDALFLHIDQSIFPQTISDAAGRKSEKSEIIRLDNRK